MVEEETAGKFDSMIKQIDQGLLEAQSRMVKFLLSYSARGELPTSDLMRPISELVRGITSDGRMMITYSMSLILRYRLGFDTSGEELFLKGKLVEYQGNVDRLCLLLQNDNDLS